MCQLMMHVLCLKRLYVPQHLVSAYFNLSDQREKHIYFSMSNSLTEIAGR